jgi:hypothetical protein
MLVKDQNEIAIRGNVMALWLDLVNLHGAHGGSVSRAKFYSVRSMLNKEKDEEDATG